MPKEFTLPDLGEGIVEAQVIRVLISEGDRVEEDQYLMEVETDKAAVEIPSPFAGTATAVHVKEGQTINVGDVIVTFDGDGTSSSTGAKRSAAKAKDGGTATAVAPPPAVQAPTRASAASGTSSKKTSAAAAPVVRKLARELGVDLDTVSGTGPGGRITREDVQRQASMGSLAAPPAPGGQAAPAAGQRLARPASPASGEPGTDSWGPVRREPISQIRKTIATQMSRSAFTAVHVTHCDEADITELERMRRRLNKATDGNPKLTVMSFVIRATCLAIKKYPIFNASFDMDAGQIIYKDYINMGIAVDSQRGLIVPVVRHADQLGLGGIALALRDLADRIRANQFAIEDLRGGTFTITNVGALGGRVSTPVINYPEVAILGLGRSHKVPVFTSDDELSAALMLPINLSFDHRATDGADTARFAGEIISYLETPEKFLLD